MVDFKELYSTVKHQIGKLFAQVQHMVQGPLFFLAYINDLTKNLKSNVKLFANDTPLFSEICDPLETVTVNSGKWFLTQIQLNKLRK